MTSVSGFNSRPIFPLHVSASVETVALPAVKTAPADTDSNAVRSERNAGLADSPDRRARADAQVAKSFARALATRSYQTSMAPPNVEVPLQSTLGRWRTQLDSAFKGPGFLAWAKEQGLDTRHLKLHPARGELSGIVDGKEQTFSLKDDSGWSDISRTLLSIAKAIAPEYGQAFSYPWPDGEVPLYTVGRFYNKPIDLSPAQAVEHRKRLAEKALFEFAPVAHASLRSAEAIAQQQKSLGEDANRHALITALKSQVDDANGKIDLDKVNVLIDSRSGRFAREQRREMSVAQILKLEGNNVPINSKQAQGMALALSFDLAHRAPQLDSGGVRPVVGLLGATSLRKMRAVVDEWKTRQVPRVSNPQSEAATGSLLRMLISAIPAPTRQAMAQNPALAREQLIRSPEAQALGQNIQKRLKILETPTSAIESVNAALIQELDPDVGKSRFNVAGYNLYDKNNAGASPAEIVKRFTIHLESRVGVEAAPVAAQLLLSAAAPEFLVRDIPANIIYGSHTWANFSIEALRIEQQLPGASANMTFSQIMAYGGAPLISLESEDQLSAASGNPIIAWGLANDVIDSKPNHVYAYADIKRSQDALNKQQEELEWARAALLLPATTRKELALAELKRVFPDVDPTKNVLQSPGVKHDPVSLLDIYMSGPIEPDKWMSLNNKDLPWNALKSRLSELIPDINKPFDEKFQEYKKTHESAWAIQFKYQLSLLPLADRERIRQSNISVMEVSRPFLGTQLEPSHSLFPRRIPRLPTAPELAALKGKHGLLMKVQSQDGSVDYYSYFPALGKLIKEQGFPGDQNNANDSAYFGGSSKGRVAGTYNVYKQYGEVDNVQDQPRVDGKVPGAYFSGRNGSLGLGVGKFFTKDYEALKSVAAEVTALEKGRAYDEKLKGFFLGLIPFYDGIQDAIKGNVSGAVFNIGFDILGFILPGLNTARKAYRAGKSAPHVIKSFVFAGVGASVGYTDAVDIAKNLNRGASAGYKDIKYLINHGDEVLSRLKGHYQRYDVTRVYKEGDIVKGFYRSETNNLFIPVVAVFKKSAWYSYSIITNAPFGPQLAQFGVVSALESLKGKS
ncbi:hypothetical protein ACWHY4_21335 [Pseudomonas sp. E2-15]